MLEKSKDEPRIDIAQKLGYKKSREPPSFPIS